MPRLAFIKSRDDKERGRQYRMRILFLPTFGRFVMAGEKEWLAMTKRVNKKPSTNKHFVNYRSRLAL